MHACTGRRPSPIVVLVGKAKSAQSLCLEPCQTRPPCSPLEARQRAAETVNVYIDCNGLYTFMGKQFDEGVALMEKATEQDSTFGMAWLNLQALYVMTNQGNKRLETVKKAMEYMYKIPERFQWIVKLVLFDANHENDKTASLIKMQLDLYPHDMLAHEMQSLIFMASADFDAVINTYKVMLEIDPSQHEYLIKIGRFYEGALDDYIKQAISKYPDKVQEYRKGKKRLIGLFMGEVMRLSKGKADPKLANQLLTRELEK